MSWPIHLIDVSAHQSAALDWAAIKRAGVSVALAKASEGVGSPDSWRARHLAGARGAGLRVGVYHYLRVRANRPQDAAAQAAEFCAIWSAERCDLRPVVDVETMSNGGASLAEWRASVLGFVAEVERGTGMSPAIYTSAGEWLGLGLGGLVEVSRCPLWLAAYTSNTPAAPAPWREWSAWQYTGTGKIQGVPVDLDLSVATVDGLSALLASGGGVARTLGAAAVVGALLALAWRYAGKLELLKR